ncbi:MAG TPA: FxsA family protein [Geminicoccaceae bacterium]
MPRLLFLLVLLALAGLELLVIVRVAGGIGVLPTLLLLVGIGVLGMMLVRRQGLATIARVQASLQAGRLPVADVFEGVCILVAGLLLALPGLLSDVAGVALLLPPLRRLLYKALARRLGDPAVLARGRPTPRRGVGVEVIEGQFEEVGPAPPTPLPPRGSRPGP